MSFEWQPLSQRNGVSYFTDRELTVHEALLVQGASEGSLEAIVSLLESRCTWPELKQSIRSLPFSSLSTLVEECAASLQLGLDITKLLFSLSKR